VAVAEVTGPQPTAVLFSGGLDSAVLLGVEARRGPVHPLYVSVGLAWEADERRAAALVLAAPCFAARPGPLVPLAFDVRDLYGPAHWAVRGTPPAWHTPDEDVYLPGRNVVLLAKAALWAAQHGVARLALGPLAGNPFPDASPEFFAAMARALSLGLAHPLEIVTPLAHLHKDAVIRLGVELGVPLGLTLSCMNPADGRHCGACSKCRERHDAFTAAGVPDPTSYASPAQ
jgi:7-cyano-7-deazaguanine synthase